jgi:hypothetical protein
MREITSLQVVCTENPGPRSSDSIQVFNWDAIESGVK